MIINDVKSVRKSEITMLVILWLGFRASELIALTLVYSGIKLKYTREHASTPYY